MNKMKNGKLNGKVAIVTGASKGIGADIAKQFDVKILGLLLATQEAVKQFDSTGGNIINVSSTVTSLTPPGSSVYTATKGAVDAITRTLAKELGPRKIRVNAINPGMVETEGVRAAGF